MLRLATVRARPGSRAPALILLVVSAAATAGIVIAGKRIPPWSFALLLAVAAGSFFFLLHRETKRPALACWMVFAATAIVMTIAVAVPPRTSNDVWAYAIYGRIVTAHDTSPYVHPPQDFPNDPYYLRARRGYHNIKSVYGPVWVILAGLIAQVANALGGDIVYHLMGHRLLADLAHLQFEIDARRQLHLQLNLVPHHALEPGLDQLLRHLLTNATFI